MTHKPGTRIETHGTPSIGAFPAVSPETGVVCRPRKESLPLPGPDWHIVKFDRDNVKLCLHASAFRAISN